MGQLQLVDPDGPVVIILASGSEVRGFDPGIKILSMTSFGREVKQYVPCRRFTARKKEPEAEIRASNKNLSAFSHSL